MNQPSEEAQCLAKYLFYNQDDFLDYKSAWGDDRTINLQELIKVIDTYFNSGQRNVYL